MNFYFCETCGKRVTEKDIDAGAARNKKLKGVFCADCAVGVMTMENLPVSPDQALKILGKAPSNARIAPASESPAKPRRDSSISMRPHAAPHAPAAESSNAVVGIAAGVIAVLVLGIFAAMSGGGKAPKTAGNAAPPPMVSPSKPATPSNPNSAPAPVIDNAPVKRAPVPAPTPAPASAPQDAPVPAAPETKTAPAVPEVVNKPEAPPQPTTPAPIQPAPPVDPPATVAQPARAATPRITPAITEEQRAALRAYDDVLAKLGSQQSAAALAAARKLPDAGPLVALLERADAVRGKALEALNKKPPSAPVSCKFKGAEVSGQLKRTEGDFAWISAKGMEVRIPAADLPPDVFRDALGLDASTPENAYDLAACQMAGGQADAAIALIKHMDAAKSAELFAFVAQYKSLQRAVQYESAVAAVEDAIKEAKSADAFRQIAMLKKNYPDLAEKSQQQRVADLEKRTEGIKIVNQLAKDLVLYWAFEENNGGVTRDLSPNGWVGTIVGATWSKGIFGGGLSFAAGTQDYVRASALPDDKVVDNFTQALWVKPDVPRATVSESATTNDGMGLAYTLYPRQYDIPGHAGAGISVGTNGICVVEHADAYMPPLLVYDRKISGWTHVAVVYTDKRPKLYVNGRLVRTGLRSARIVHPGTSPGATHYKSFGGSLDEVRIYSRPLTDDEVAHLAAFKVPAK